MLKKLLFTLLVIPFVLSACAGIEPLSYEKGEAIKTGNTLVSFYQIEKRIEYNELVYKVLWNENRSQEAVFGPLWDIDSDLSTRLSKNLNGSGFNTQAIHEALSPSLLGQYKTVYAKSDIPGVGIRASDHDLELPQDLRNELLAKEVDYLLTIYSDYTYSYAQVGVKLVASRSQISIIDVRENMEIYFTPMGFQENPKVEQSIREIENNNLAKFKDIMRKGIDSISEEIPKSIGLIAKK